MMQINLDFYFVVSFWVASLHGVYSTEPARGTLVLLIDFFLSLES
jgi:hypothetical protein